MSSIPTIRLKQVVTVKSDVSDALRRSLTACKDRHQCNIDTVAPIIVFPNTPLSNNQQAAVSANTKMEMSNSQASIGGHNKNNHIREKRFILARNKPSVLARCVNGRKDPPPMTSSEVLDLLPPVHMGSVTTSLQRFIGEPKNSSHLKRKSSVTVCPVSGSVAVSTSLSAHLAKVQKTVQVAKQQQLDQKQQVASVSQSSSPFTNEDSREVSDSNGELVKEHDYGWKKQEKPSSDPFDPPPLSERCPMCKRRLAKDRYQSHLKLIHGITTTATENISEKEVAKKPYQCESCSSRFGMRRLLLIHQEICSSVEKRAKSLKCEQCGSLFLNDVSLKKHARLAHNIFKCFECDVDLETRQALAKHNSEVHTNNRKFTTFYL